MAKNIITISREYGSGGRQIGRLVADKLGYAFYDKELIALVAKESGFTLEYVEEVSEQVTNSFLYALATGGFYGQSTYTRDTLPVQDTVYILQNRIVKEIADKGPCVIIGRSADFILRERDDCVNVFIHADMQSRIRRAIDEYGLNEKDIEKTLLKKDKSRASYYRRYTDRVWGMARNYSLTLDSGLFGLEQSADIIAGIASK